MNTEQQNEYWERMTKYLSNELDPVEKSSFEDWANNTDGQTLLKEMKADMEKMDEAKYVFMKTEDEAWSELYARIQQDEKENSTRAVPFRLPHILYRVAATIIILFGLGWGIYQLTKSPSQSILSTAYAQSEITLPDGSIVYLNANSKLLYPKSFNENSRKVELIGEGFFEIQPNPDKPFIITANNAEIEVLGTKFNVMAYQNDDKVEVLVESGLVSLSSKSNGKKTILLEKGQFGIVNDDLVREEKQDNINYLSWRTKMMEFRNESLPKVIEVINHTYGTNIVLASEPMKDLVLTSKYDKINLDTLLTSICVAFNLEKSEIDDQIILASKKR